MYDSELDHLKIMYSEEKVDDIDVKQRELAFNIVITLLTRNSFIDR